LRLSFESAITLRFPPIKYSTRLEVAIFFRLALTETALHTNLLSFYVFYTERVGKAESIPSNATSQPKAAMKIGPIAPLAVPMKL